MSDPVTRQEQLLSAIATGGDIISPVTREEMYLAYLAGDTSVVLPEPITRKEQFLHQACLNGGGGGGGTEITDGIVVKARDANGYATEVDFYGTAINRYQFGSVYENDFGFKKITSINLKNKITAVGDRAFRNCSSLTTLNGIDFGAITTLGEGAFSGTAALALGQVNLTGLTSYNKSYVFADCGGISKLHMHTDGTMHYGFINNCPNLTEIILDCIVNFTGGSSGASYAALGRNTALTNCQIGNIGKACTMTASGMFSGCTQTGLTITVYTTGAYADTAVTNIRNGATNATIIIKASEDTTYNGVAYAAGETMITSTVEATA